MFIYKKKIVFVQAKIDLNKKNTQNGKLIRNRFV